MSSDEIRERTQGVWDRFYCFRSIWTRSGCVSSLRGRLAFVLISKLYRQMYANTGISTDKRPKEKVKPARPLDGQAVPPSVPGKADARSSSPYYPHHQFARVSYEPPG